MILDEHGRPIYRFKPGTKLTDFLTSTRIFDVIMGPLGSGKTVAVCLRIMRHAQEQWKSPIDGMRYTRFALVRNTYPDLKTTTIRTWRETHPEDVYGQINMGQPPQHRIAFDDVRMEVDFLALDKDEDIRKLRSTEYTGIAFNELPFIPKSIVDEATSRLRYPPKIHGGPRWRGVIADANAPAEDHWLATMTGQIDPPAGISEEELALYQWPPSWGFHLQPPALIEHFDERGRLVRYSVNPKAENLENLPDTYYDEQLVGKKKDWIDSRLMVRVVFVAEGSPVWPMFRRDFHVAPEALVPLPEREVVVGLDFGRVYPAAVFAQEINGRINIQFEMLGFNEGATVFAPKVKRFLEKTYQGCKVRFIGDPKGWDKGQATEQSSVEVYASLGMPVIKAPFKQNNIEERVETVAFALNDNPSGVNRLVISPVCRTLIVGMAGRYHLVKEEGGKFIPSKNKYSNLSDALGYLLGGIGESRRMIGLQPAVSARPVALVRPRGARRRVA